MRARAWGFFSELLSEHRFSRGGGLAIRSSPLVSLSRAHTRARARRSPFSGAATTLAFRTARFSRFDGRFDGPTRASFSRIKRHAPFKSRRAFCCVWESFRILLRIARGDGWIIERVRKGLRGGLHSKRNRREAARSCACAVSRGMVWCSRGVPSFGATLRPAVLRAPRRGCGPAPPHHGDACRRSLSPTRSRSRHRRRPTRRRRRRRSPPAAARRGGSTTPAEEAARAAARQRPHSRPCRRCTMRARTTARSSIGGVGRAAADPARTAR